MWVIIKFVTIIAQDLVCISASSHVTVLTQVKSLKGMMGL